MPEFTNDFKESMLSVPPRVITAERIINLMETVSHGVQYLYKIVRTDAIGYHRIPVVPFAATHRCAHSLHGLKCRCSLRDAKAPPSQCSQHQKVRSSAYPEPRCPLPNRRIIASVPRRPCTSRVSSNPSARAFRSFDDAVQVDGRESTRKYLS